MFHWVNVTVTGWWVGEWLMCERERERNRVRERARENKCQDGWLEEVCMSGEVSLLACWSNCMFRMCFSQSPDATVYFYPLTPLALLFIPDYRLAEGLSNRMPHNQSQDFSTTSSHNSSDRSGSLSGWFRMWQAGIWLFFLLPLTFWDTSWTAI